MAGNSSAKRENVRNRRVLFMPHCLRLRATLEPPYAILHPILLIKCSFNWFYDSWIISTRYLNCLFLQFYRYRASGCEGVCIDHIS